jgi:L-asparaginase
VEYEVVNVLRKDSLEITDEDRALIRATIEAAPERAIVVTHGTDTMAETGRVLGGIPGKVVVLTGSLHPARFKSSDAVFNVASAVTAVQTLPEGVYITMNGRIYDPGRVRKNRELNVFEEIEDGSTDG